MCGGSILPATLTPSHILAQNPPPPVPPAPVGGVAAGAGVDDAQQQGGTGVVAHAGAVKRDAVTAELWGAGRERG